MTTRAEVASTLETAIRCEEGFCLFCGLPNGHHVKSCAASDAVASALAEIDRLTAELAVVADEVRRLEWAYVEAEKAAARVGAERDRLRTELAEAQHWRERHCKDAAAYGAKSNENWNEVQRLRAALEAICRHDHVDHCQADRLECYEW